MVGERSLSWGTKAVEHKTPKSIGTLEPITITSFFRRHFGNVNYFWCEYNGWGALLKLRHKNTWTQTAVSPSEHPKPSQALLPRYFDSLNSFSIEYQQRRGTNMKGCVRVCAGTLLLTSCLSQALQRRRSTGGRESRYWHRRWWGADTQRMSQYAWGALRTKRKVGRTDHERKCRPASVGGNVKKDM